MSLTHSLCLTHTHTLTHTHILSQTIISLSFLNYSLLMCLHLEKLRMPRDCAYSASLRSTTALRGEEPISHLQFGAQRVNNSSSSFFSRYRGKRKRVLDRQLWKETPPSEKKIKLFGAKTFSPKFFFKPICALWKAVKKIFVDTNALL